MLDLQNKELVLQAQYHIAEYLRGPLTSESDCVTTPYTYRVPVAAGIKLTTNYY